MYVFCIVTRSFESPRGDSDMDFFIDGQLVGSYVHPPNGDGTYEYNVPVYANDSLPPGEHTIIVVNGRPSGRQSLTLLDYIIYSLVIAPLFIVSCATLIYSTGKTTARQIPP